MIDRINAVKVNASNMKMKNKLLLKNSSKKM